MPARLPHGCESPARAAYGWQRDGGHADYLLAEESTCILLPHEQSHVDGALVSCGFGTAYEGLLRLGLSGWDRLLITGLGPVGLAAAMLGRAMGAEPIIGTDIVPGRLELARSLGLVDHAVPADGAAGETIAELTDGRGCEARIDCSGSPALATSPWQPPAPGAGAPSSARVEKSPSRCRNC